MDGTLFCETDPTYFDFKLLMYRVLEDEDYREMATDQERLVVKKIQDYINTGELAEGLEYDAGQAIASSDISMARYVTVNNPYKTRVFMLCCDDTERENGNPGKAEKMRAMCEENDWVPVSMKNDWETIYAPNVTKKESLQENT